MPASATTFPSTSTSSTSTSTESLAALTEEDLYSVMRDLQKQVEFYDIQVNNIAIYIDICSILWLHWYCFTINEFIYVNIIIIGGVREGRDEEPQERAHPSQGGKIYIYI